MQNATLTDGIVVACVTHSFGGARQFKEFAEKQGKGRW